ncbi:hypothetical protein HOLleu_08529 [Holothuria leucospilota]|uniref:Uncharacterized protein n=1 Tax=Holothuria leucospilota TaxID=206669 RepID=A0A9Q1HHY6_HOLLE|nr:hypothetical protein HOLleu_08529 [Holothuria leucospilota]
MTHNDDKYGSVGGTYMYRHVQILTFSATVNHMYLSNDTQNSGVAYFLFKTIKTEHLSCFCMGISF